MSGQSWQAAYLSALGARVTPQAVAVLDKWQPWEGGHTQNNAQYNYFNTTERMPGSHPINSVGVQAYGSLAQGAKAFAKTLLSNPNYAGLVGLLRTGQGDATPALSTWLTGSPVSPHGLSYAAKVLGTPQPAGIGSAGGPEVAPEGTGAPSPLSPPEQTTSAARNTQSIHDQAVVNLRDIAQGAQPTDEVASLASLAQSLKAAAPAMPTSSPSLNTSPSGDGSLEHQAVTLAHKYVGVKYTWGGTSAQTGFDCSGLVQTVWKQLGVDVPRSSQEQYHAGKPVAVSDLKPGDALFFVGSDGSAQAPGHEGMYIGDGKYIVAPHTGTNVQVASLADAKDLVGARRFA